MIDISRVIYVQQYNHLTDVAVLKFDRYRNGIDLSVLTCNIYTKDNKITADVDDTLIKSVTDDYITLTWTLAREYTQEKMLYQVAFEGDVTFLCTPNYIVPDKSVDINKVNNEIYVSNVVLLNQWQANMDDLRSVCQTMLAATEELREKLTENLRPEYEDCHLARVWLITDEDTEERSEE